MSSAMQLRYVMFPFVLATALVLMGVPLATNWRGWADRQSAWGKRTFGRLGSSPGYVRAVGITWVVIGIILYIAWASSLAAGTGTR